MSKKAISLQLFNTIGNDLEEDVPLKELPRFSNQLYTQQDVLDVFNSKKVTKQSFLWKGHIYGLVTFDDKTRAVMKISRYGAFLRELNSSKLYVFSAEDSEKWQSLIDNFIDDATLK